MSFPSLVKPASPTAYAELGTGNSFTDPSFAADTSETTYAYIAAGSLGLSKVLLVKGFDFSWFDTANYDVTGMTVIMAFHGTNPGVNEFSKVQLYDETGTAIGSSVHSAFITPGWASAEISVNISAATLTNAAFGLGLQFNAITSVGGAVEYVQLIPKFTRKVVTSATGYGLQIQDSGGAAKLTDASTFVRQVSVTHKDGGFTGTVSIPDFDDTKGVIFFNSHWEKMTTGGVQQLKTEPWASNILIHGHGMELPAINWDNTTKVMTISTGGNYPLPAGFEHFFDMSCGVAITAVHYR